MQTSHSPWGRRLLIVGLLVAIIAAVIVWATRPKPVQVALAQVDRGLVESTLANTRAGSVEACQRTRLSTIMGGRIETLAVKEGDSVRKGQLLLQLWNDDQSAQSALVQAQLATARQRINEACTLADSAEKEAARLADLRQKGFVSASKEESTRAEAAARRASCDTVRSDVRQAEARVAQVEVERQRTRLVAPFDGTVARIVGERGEYTTPSPPGVATPPAIDLIDPSCLYIKAPMDEVDAPKISAGQTARITLDALPGQQFAGTVRRVAPVVTALEKQARTVDVEVRFADPLAAQGLLVGYSADLEIILQQQADALRIPTAALLEGKRVLALKDGRLEERTLRTGVANWEYTEVLEGLVVGESVVVSLERDGVKAGALAVEDAAR